MPSIVSVPAPTAEIPHQEHFQVDDGNWVFLRLGYNFDSAARWVSLVCLGQSLEMGLAVWYGDDDLLPSLAVCLWWSINLYH